MVDQQSKKPAVLSEAHKFKRQDVQGYIYCDDNVSVVLDLSHAVQERGEFACGCAVDIATRYHIFFSFLF